MKVFPYERSLKTMGYAQEVIKELVGETEKAHLMALFEGK